MQQLQLRDLPIADIVPSLQFRELNRAKVEELKVSISEKGLLQPIRVRPLRERPEGKFKVSFGDHRLQACKELGWKTIPSIIGTGDETSEGTLGIIENLHRNENVNYALLGDWFNRLMKDENWDLARCAHEINKTTTYVERCLDIAEKVDPTLHRQLGDLIPRSLASDFSRLPMGNQRSTLEVIRKRSAKQLLSRNSIAGMIRFRLNVKPRAQVYTCNNCGGLLTSGDLETGRAEAARLKDDLFFVHAKPEDCEFNDTLVATYNGKMRKTDVRGILEYAKGKLEEQGVQVSMRLHYVRRPRGTGSKAA
jgi:ParB/RepB/Spo0J family partition protein